MDYPIVYDKFETDFTTFGLAVLENVYELRVFQRLNGDYVCTFGIPRDDEKFDYLSEENIIKVNGQLFIVRTIEEERTTNNELLAHVECEHIFFELYDKFIDSLGLVGTTAHTALTQLLTGTRFTANALSVSNTSDVTVTQKNAIWGINHLLQVSDAELERDNFNVTLRPQIGSSNGVQFRYRKNIVSIKRKVDSRGVITRLYVYGKDGLMVGPIDSPNINLYPQPKEGSVTYSEVTDTVTLQANGNDYITTVDKPRVTYEVALIELKSLTGFGDKEAFSIGDNVLVYDDELGIIVTARIVEYEEYPLEPWRSRVTLANFLPGIEDFNSSLQDTQNIVQQVTRKGKIDTFWLDGIINTLKNQLKASGSYATAQVIDGQGFLLENTDSTSPDFGALYLGPGIFAIANSKANGDWNWRTFGTGQGFTADLINAGQINTSFIKILGSTAFFWDSENIYIINPSNQNQQIRIGKYDGTHYGIGFTTNGGTSWMNALDFNGLTIGPNNSYANGYDPSTKENAGVSVLKDTLYNKVKITPAQGVEVLDANNVQRVKIGDLGGGKYGIQIKKADSSVSFDVDSNGEISLTKGQISIDHSNGSKTVIDGAGFKIYPVGSTLTNYIGVDSGGMYRNYNGSVSRIKDAVAIGNGVIAGDGPVTGSVGAPPIEPNSTFTFDLTGGEWIGKAGNVQASFFVTSYDSPPSGGYNICKTKCQLDSISAISNGIRITVRGGCKWNQYNPSPGYYDAYGVNLNFSYIVFG